MNTTDGDTNDRKRPAAIPTVSRIEPDGTFVELLYRASEAKTEFVVFQNGAVRSEAEFVTANGERLVPFSPENNVIKNNVVLLPSEALEYGSKGDLLGEIERFLHRYLDISPAFEKIAAHYVLFTWVYDAFQENPYLRLQGDFGSGKTRGLLTIGSLCYKGFFASGASTVSPLFHILDAFRGTLILDEADFRFSDEQAEITKILNNGNVNGFPVLRTMINRNKEFNPQAFHIFGPKLVAMRGAYQDRALESRFLTEVMGTARLRSDIPINLGSTLKEEALALRNKLLMFRFRNRDTVASGLSLLHRSIAPRLRQILSPLLALVDDSATRDAILENVSAGYEALVAERTQSTEAQLLEIIRELSGEVHRTAIPVLDIADRFSARHGADYERHITPRWIGTLLRQRLHLAPFRSHGRYVLPVNNTLAALYERYGLAADIQASFPFPGSGHGDMGTLPGQ